MGAEIPERFNLSGWFSLAGLAAIAAVAISLAIFAGRCLLIEDARRDGLLMAQAIRSVAALEQRRVGAEGAASAGFLEPLAGLPGVQRVSLYGPERIVRWSSEPRLVGSGAADPDLEEAFEGGETVTSGRFGTGLLFRIVHYIPLKDETSLLEVRKAPIDSIARLRESHLGFWLAMVLGGLPIQLGLFWMLRRLAGRRSRADAGEAMAALGEMSAAVAHSLRNPLAAIRSSAELALDVEDSPARRNIEDIVGQVDRLSKYVNELLIVSRPLCGEREAVDPVALLDDVLQAFERQLRAADIRVDWPAQAVPAVLSHRLLLVQALNSVIANAIEAMPRGGSLRIRVAVDALERRLRLTVGDSGDGMTPEQMAMAFKAFHTTKRGGLGVGLVLVKRIMERFGGAIRLDSRERQGTDVCLVFRIAEER